MKNLKDKIKSNVEKKTSNLKDKIAAKVARKTGRACVAIALLAAFAGCHMGELPTAQPTAQRAQTSNITDNRFDIRIVASTNAVYDAEGNPVAAVRIEIGNLTQANETSGTETQTTTQTASPSNTPTVSTPVQIDARYNDAMAAASNVSKGVLESLTEAGANKVLSLMADKSTGTVQVTKKDGTTATVECRDGQCSIVSACPDGKCADGACADGKCTDG